MEAMISADGSTRWKGKATNTGIDNYNYGVAAVLRSNPPRLAVAFNHSGYVGGTFSPAADVQEWDEPHHSPAVQAFFKEFESGKLETSTNYESGIGSTLEEIVPLLVQIYGGAAIGARLAGVVLIGTSIVSIASGQGAGTGLLQAGGILWLMGPANTLIALGAQALADDLGTSIVIPQELYDFANNEVFAGTLPPRDQVYLSDLKPPSNAGGLTFWRYDRTIVICLGEGFSDPMNIGVPNLQSSGEALIHELVHALQFHKASSNMAVLLELLFDVIDGHASLTAPPQLPTPGPPFGEFGVEQQAYIVSSWFSGRNAAGSRIGSPVPKDETSPYFPYITQNVRTGFW
jgi:hypothetical protein